MNCDKFQRLLAFLLYDELNLEEENELHEHMEGCATCREAYVREQAMHQVLEDVDDEIPANLLMECRSGLRLKLKELNTPARQPALWRRLWDLEIPLPPAIWKPLGALALVAVGFFGARLVPRGMSGSDFFQPGTAQAVSARVRSVDMDPSGGVKLVVDETRQRVLKGGLQDEFIRELMLGAAKDPDPGLRVESIGILKDQASSAEIRQTLLFALQNDTNAGVRLKAMEGLRRFADEPETRKALSHVLLTDNNSGIRTQAIDLLTQQRERDSVGVLQEVMHKEENPYIRQRCQRALREMNASLETF